MKILLLISIGLSVMLQVESHRAGPHQAGPYRAEPHLAGPDSAWIATRQEDDLLHISGRFVNHSEEAVSLRYALQTTKEGPGGRSRSAQSGSFSAASREQIQLSQTTINLHPKDTYTIELKIFREDSLYLQDRIIH